MLRNRPGRLPGSSTRRGRGGALLDLLALCAFAAVFSGCFGFRPARVPMDSLFFEAAESPAKGLIIFLPGMGDGPSTYERRGFVDIVRSLRPDFDILAADAHFGYFRNWQVTRRLHTDLVEPILSRYDTVWVVGISIGGLVATTYAMENPEEIDGVIALAPYLGSREVIGEVRTAGGLRHWTPPDLGDIESFQRRHYYRLWDWFRQYATATPPAPRLYLGVGSEDGLFVPNMLVAEHLPAPRKATRPGGHGWTVWTPLFEELASRALRQDAEVCAEASAC